jgi:hypothetical protein
MATFTQNDVEALRKRLLKYYPDAVLETGIFNDNGDIIIRITVPGYKTIDATNLKAFQTVVENLEDQARAKFRPQ